MEQRQKLFLLLSQEVNASTAGDCSYPTVCVKEERVHLRVRVPRSFCFNEIESKTQFLEGKASVSSYYICTPLSDFFF